MKKLLIVSIFMQMLMGCSRCAKDKINEGSQKAGEVIGEVAKGVSTGIESSFEINVKLSDYLSQQGIQLGKVLVKSDSGGTDNLLVAYIIFQKDFVGTLKVKAFDNKGLEIGRSSIDVSAQKELAGYFDFHFDPRTNIDSDGKIVME